MRYLMAVAVVGVFFVSTVDAQTATDLDCSNCVSTSELEGSAVTTGKIASRAVTSGKLADDSVSTAKLIDNSVVAAKIQDAAVTSDKIADGAVTLDKVEPALASAIGTQCPPGEFVIGKGSDGQLICDLVPGSAPSVTDRFIFAGISALTVLGNSGFKGLNEACIDAFGGNARLATSKEIIDSAIFPAATATAAWVQPVIISVSGSSNAITSVDLSGIAVQARDLSCEGWNDAAEFGLVVLPANYGFSVARCNLLNAVACSLPQ